MRSCITSPQLTCRKYQSSYACYKSLVMLVIKSQIGGTRTPGGKSIMKLKICNALIATAAVLFVNSNACAQTAPISDDVVRIGVLTDMSGQFSHESGEGAVTAVKMAVEDFGGKVLGKPIEVIAADHQNKPDIAVSTAREWFDVGKVDMVANLINSSVAL